MGRIGRFDPKRTAVAAALVLGIVAAGRFVAREVGALHGGNAAERR
ncbi:membrane protein [Burkholderia dolosa PC543]|nr:membrane protein [Burkholderia dolosa PC543]